MRSSSHTVFDINYNVIIYENKIFNQLS